MNWISELFKHVTSSKIFTFSLFLTSSFLLLGNRYISSEIPEPQANIKLALIGLCIFSGTILAISLLNFLWSFFFSTANGLKIRWKGATLSEDELGLIELMGSYANEPINISLMNFEKTPFTKLEMLHLVKCLREKGFAEENPWDETIVWLSAKGREKALHLMTLRKKTNA